MKVQLLYVVAFGSQGETTEVAVGLFHKHAQKSDNALGVYAKSSEHDDEAPAKLVQIPSLVKGNPPGLDEIKTSANSTRNFKPALKKLPDTNFAAAVVPGRRASVGMYLVIPGMVPEDQRDEGGWLVRSIQPLIEMGGKPKVVCLVRCRGAHRIDKSPHGKPLAAEAQDNGLVIENMLIEFKKQNCRPLITAWAVPISASPGQRPTAGVVPFGGKLVTVEKEKQVRRPTAEDRENYKFGYFVNDDDEIVVLPASAIRNHYLT